MSKTNFLVFCAVSLFWIGTLSADPLVVFPAGNFSCAVEVTPHDPAPRPDPAHPERRTVPVVKKILITQVGRVRCDVSVFSDNSTAKLWNLLDPGLSVLASNRTSKDLYVLRGESRDEASPKLLHFDADSVSWIKEKSADKNSPGGGALHYQAKVALPTDVGPVQYALYQAWIDPKSLIPQRFDDGEALYVLTFSPTPPTDPLVVPENVQAEVKRWTAATTAHPHL